MGRSWLCILLAVFLLGACGDDEYGTQEGTVTPGGGGGGGGVTGFLLRATFPPDQKLTAPTKWKVVGPSGETVFTHTDCPTRGPMMPFLTYTEASALDRSTKIGDNYVTLVASSLTQAEDKSMSTFTLEDPSRFSSVPNGMALLKAGNLTILIERR